MSFQISPKYEEVHEHYDGTCIESHRRKIGFHEYLFTRVANKDRTIISVSQFDVIGIRKHLISGRTNGK